MDEIIAVRYKGEENERMITIEFSSEAGIEVWLDALRAILSFVSFPQELIKERLDAEQVMAETEAITKEEIIGLIEKKYPQFASKELFRDIRQL